MRVTEHEPETLRRARWLEAAETYLPIVSSPWRFNKMVRDDLPRQGWKLHVSATLLNATNTLSIVAECLRGENVYYKAPMTLGELARLNTGILYDYHQIGKFLTIYPIDKGEVVRIAQKLADATEGQAGPAVPFETRVAKNSPVFARYGLFRVEKGPNGHLLLGPDGGTEEDRRDRNPQWARAPEGLWAPTLASSGSPLSSRFRIYGCLSQRGKGGVYQAVDLDAAPARICVIKEGRRHGEVDIDGNDGRSRLQTEHEVLSSLSASGVPVPRPYTMFEGAGHGYLVMEWLPGLVLGGQVLDGERPLPKEVARDLAAQVSGLVRDVHRNGWVWRDVKASNFILQGDGRLRPLDFEGAVREGGEVTSPWGSPGHLPPGVHRQRTATFSHDLFALGSLLYQLFTSEIPDGNASSLTVGPGLSIPGAISALIKELWSDDPTRRPLASSVQIRLKDCSI